MFKFRDLIVKMFKFRDLKVKWKIILPYSLLIFLIVGFILSWYIISEAERLEVQQMQKMEIVIQGLAEASSHPFAIRQYDRLREILSHTVNIDPDIQYVHLLNNATICLVCTDKSLEGKPMPDEDHLKIINLPSEASLVELTGDKADYELRYPVKLFNVVMGKLHMGISRTGIHTAVKRSIYINIMIGLATVIIGIIIFILIIRIGVSNPILELSRASREISSGNLNKRMVYSSREELGQLAGAFTTLATQLVCTLEGLEEEVDERKQSEEETSKHAALLEEAVKELESFSYSVSHDLRAPLRAIDGFSRILLEDYYDKLDAEGKRVIDSIIKNTKRMGQLIDDLLTFSSTGRKEISRSEIDMESLAKTGFEELKPVTADRQIQFIVGMLPPAQGDRTLVLQVIVNLLSNAVKFTTPRETAVIEIGCKIGDNESIYYVKDNGVGFNMKYADKLFGVFQRLHGIEEFEGTGIGLALVQRIIHRHGGRVWAEAKVNRGATFYFTLPGKGGGK